MRARGGGVERSGSKRQGEWEMHDKPPAGMNRRSFFGAVGGASATVVATLVPGEAQAYDPGGEEMRARYQETEHVKTFYRVNGYETLKG